MKHVDFNLGGVGGVAAAALLKPPKREPGKTFVVISLGGVSEEHCASSVPYQLFLLNMNTSPPLKKSND